MPARPYYIPCRPSRTIYAMPARPYHIPCHARQAMLDLQDHTMYHARPARPCHLSCQVIPCTMLGPPDHVIYHVMSYHIPWYTRQTILFSFPCPPGLTIDTIYHAMPTMPYHIPCHALPDHAIYLAMPRQTIPYTMLCLPAYHLLCHVHQAIPYTMPCPSG